MRKYALITGAILLKGIVLVVLKFLGILQLGWFLVTLPLYFPLVVIVLCISLILWANM